MIEMKLSSEEKNRLETYKTKTSPEISERITMILLNNGGMSPVKIAERLDKNPHTVRKWLFRYEPEGIKGLDRKYSPGRPDKLRKVVKTYILDLIKKSPKEYGYKIDLWNVVLLKKFISNHRNLPISEDTIERSLKDLGFVSNRNNKCLTVDSDLVEKQHHEKEYFLKGWKKI